LVLLPHTGNLPVVSTVQSVDRALDLLVAVARGPAGLTELARRAALPVSTTSRLLGTLEARRAVSRSAEGQYEVGSLLARIGHRGVPPADLESLARPHVTAAAELVGEAVALSVPLADDSLTLFQVDTPKPVLAHDWSGARWPLTAGGSGLVMLATWSEGRVDEVLKAPLRECTPMTCTDRAEVRRRLAKITKTNLSWSTDEYVIDLTSVASAIVDPDGRAIASVQIYGPSYRFPGRGDKGALESMVRDLAGRIARDAFDGRTP
jgi:DNA-binding IclR family transcriptional regulator